MPAGRPKKPTAVKLMQASRGHRPLPENEPQLPVEAPEMPASFSAEEQRYWNQYTAILLEMRVLNKAHGPALTSMCQTAAMLNTAQVELAEHGMFYLDHGVKRTTPAFRVSSQLRKQLEKMLSQFGMTASSQASVKAAPPVPSDMSNRWARFAAKCNPTLRKLKEEAEAAAQA